VNGSIMRAASMSISGTITSFGTVFDKLIGGQRSADDAAIDQKGDLIKKQVAQNNADAANSFLDDAKEKRKNAQSALIAHVQLAAEAGSKASQL
jgi:transposase-like protein